LPKQSTPDITSFITTVQDDSISNIKTATSGGDMKTKLDVLCITTTDVVLTPPGLPIPSNNFTVLLVEDNQINLKVGMRSQSVNTITYRIQLLIMHMRKLKKPYQIALNGFEALQAFKENPLSLRFILMG
jgi:hypothetical protein